MHDHSGPSGGVAPGAAVRDGEAEPRVWMFVRNPCVHDARVLREAQTLAARGYRVRIVATQRPELPQREERDGFEILRVPVLPLHYRVLRWYRRLPTAAAYRRRVRRRWKLVSTPLRRRTARRRTLLRAQLARRRRLVRRRLVLARGEISRAPLARRPGRPPRGRRRRRGGTSRAALVLAAAPAVALLV